MKGVLFAADLKRDVRVDACVDALGDGVGVSECGQVACCALFQGFVED